MTLEEKIAQMLQLVVSYFVGLKEEGQITGPMESLGITEETVKQKVSSVLGLGGAEIVKKMKYGADLHELIQLGLNMLFPLSGKSSTVYVHCGNLHVNCV